MPYSSPILHNRIEIEDEERDEDELHYIMLSIKLITIITLTLAALQKHVAHAVKSFAG